MRIVAGESRISFRPTSMLKNKGVAFSPIADLFCVSAIEAFFGGFLPLSSPKRDKHLAEAAETLHPKVEAHITQCLLPGV